MPEPNTSRTDRTSAKKGYAGTPKPAGCATAPELALKPCRLCYGRPRNALNLLTAYTAAIRRIIQQTPPTMPLGDTQRTSPTTLRPRISLENPPTMLRPRISLENPPTMLRPRISLENLPTMLRHELALKICPLCYTSILLGNSQRTLPTMLRPLISLEIPPAMLRSVPQ